jgi:hypothetical protein
MTVPRVVLMRVQWLEAGEMGNKSPRNIRLSDGHIKIPPARI